MLLKNPEILIGVNNNIIEKVEILKNNKVDKNCTSCLRICTTKYMTCLFCHNTHCVKCRVINNITYNSICVNY